MFPCSLHHASRFSKRYGESPNPPTRMMRYLFSVKSFSIYYYKALTSTLWFIPFASSTWASTRLMTCLMTGSNRDVISVLLVLVKMDDQAMKRRSTKTTWPFRRHRHNVQGSWNPISVAQCLSLCRSPWESLSSLARMTA